MEEARSLTEGLYCLCSNFSLMTKYIFFLPVLGREEKKLTIWDLHHLLFLLANVATKWRAIGDGLHFPKQMLDTIGQKVVCIVEGPMECLRKMLALWLGPDKPPECDPTTVHVLALALRHPNVNAGQLANRIERWPAGTAYTFMLGLSYQVKMLLCVATEKI